MATEVDRQEVQRLVTAGAQLIDVLPPREYEQLHLAGAINIPLKALDRQSTASLPKNRGLIAYCHDYQ